MQCNPDSEYLTHSVKINILNLKDEEILCFPLAFITGEIACNVCGLCKLGNFVTVNDREEKWLVVDGKFKLLFLLKLGDNKLLIKFEDEGRHCVNIEKTLKYQPSITDRVLRLAYVIPRGDWGNFQHVAGNDNSPKIAVHKIKVGALLLQMLTAERLDEEGFGKKTFQVERDLEQEVVCHVFESKQTKDEIWSKTGDEIWKDIAKELLAAKLIDERSKVLAFLSCTEYKWTENIPNKIKTANDFSLAVQNTKAYVACGAGNLALLGSASLFSWPSTIQEIYQCFTSSEPVDTKLLLDDSGFRGTYGGCFASSLGSALHELGHAFDLVHSKEGIMARGFDDIDSFFSVRGERVAKAERGTVSITVRNSEVSKKKRRHDGEAFWNRSAAVILSGHQWFNTEPVSDDLGPPFVTGMEVRSPNGLRLVELRMENDFVLKFWEFVKNSRPLKIFRLSYADCCGKYICVYVQDFRGNSIKHKMQFE